MSDIKVTVVPFSGENYDEYVAKMARVSHSQQPAKRSDSELVQRLRSDLDTPHWTPFAHIQYVYAIELHFDRSDVMLGTTTLIKLRGDMAEALSSDMFDATYSPMIGDKRKVFIRASLQHLLNLIGNKDKYNVLYDLLLAPHGAEPTTSVAFESIAQAGRAVLAEAGPAIIQQANCTWFDGMRALVTVLPAAYPTCEDPFSAKSVESTLLKETFSIKPELFTTTLLIENIPLWMATQFLRHRRGVVVNQQSFRYSSGMSQDAWKYEYKWRKQSKNKATAGQAPPVDWSGLSMAFVHSNCDEAIYRLRDAYSQALRAGVAKECARDLLPSYFPTNMYVTLTREALDRIIHLRGGPEAQAEWHPLVEQLREVRNMGPTS